MGYRNEYDEVPVAGDGEVDGHWLELQHTTSLVPTSYLPAATGGPLHPGYRVVAAVIIAMLVTVTGLGVCLTYGPQELFDFLRLS